MSETPNPFEGEPIELVCEAVINVLVEQYELAAIEVKFDGRLGRTLGRAEYFTRTIRINKLILPHWDSLHDTLLHEFAHFLAYDRGHFNHAHGLVWKETAKEVGAVPSASQKWNNENLQANGIRYMYLCGKGCKIASFRRRPKLERSNAFCTVHGLRLVRKDLY